MIEEFDDFEDISEIADENDFQEMRAEAHAFMKNKEETLLNKWLEHIGFKGTIGYYFNLSKKELEIYTTCPGMLIGRAGIHVEELKTELTKQFSYHQGWTVRFVEVRGNFITINKEV